MYKCVQVTIWLIFFFSYKAEIWFSVQLIPCFALCFRMTQNSKRLVGQSWSMSLLRWEIRVGKDRDVTPFLLWFIDFIEGLNPKPGNFKMHLFHLSLQPWPRDVFTWQRQELESENKKLRHDLAEMRQSLLSDSSTGAGAPGSPAYKVLLDQLNASCEELEVRKEEVLILRSQLVSQKEAMHHKVKNHTHSVELLYSSRCWWMVCNLPESPRCISMFSPPCLCLCSTASQNRNNYVIYTLKISFTLTKHF